jgi:hypothetical protein
MKSFVIYYLKNIILFFENIKIFDETLSIDNLDNEQLINIKKIFIYY